MPELDWALERLFVLDEVGSPVELDATLREAISVLDVA